MVRGAPIASFGSVDLLVRDAEGKPDRMMQADETVYLHPERALTPEGSLVIGEHDLPDVVLEVDHTTDVRPGKLVLYEAWGFPELWVVVPPAGRRGGSRRGDDSPDARRTIRLAGRERGSPGVDRGGDSRGPYRAGDGADVRRAGAGGAGAGRAGRDGARRRPDAARAGRAVARAGAAEGRSRGLAEGHSRGVAEGRAEGLAEGRAQERAALVRSILEARGMSFADEASDAVVDVPRDAAVAAAVTCTDAEDFRRRLDARRG